MKKLLLLFGFISLTFTGKAQWVSQQTGQTTNSQIYSLSIADPNAVWAITSVSELLHTTNGGSTWTVIPLGSATGINNLQVSCISAISASTAWITTLSRGPNLPGGVFKTINGGQTWTHQTSAYTPGCYPNMIHFFNNNDGITMGDANGGYFEIYTTNNGGNSWTRVPVSNLPPPAGNLDEGLGGDFYSVSGNTIWVSVAGMRVLKSTDKGLNWTVANTGLPQAPYVNLPLGIGFTDSNNGLVLAGSQLKRTTDGGQTWSAVNYTGPLKMYLSEVPGAPKTYISTGPGGMGPNGPYPLGSSFSTDGGNTWVNLESVNPHRLPRPRFLNPITGWSSGNSNLFKFTGTALGVKEVVKNNSFLIAPNPGQGLFAISSASPQAFSLEIYDMAGHKIQEQKGNRFGKTTIDLTNQKKGIYLLHILNGQQRLLQKIVLQ